MFEPAAPSLISALISASNPAAIAGNAVMLENSDSTGDLAEGRQTGGFEAMLALQSAQAHIPLSANRLIAQPVAKAVSPTLAQTATGKTLPDLAMPLAALAAFAGNVTETFGDPDQEIGTAALESIADPAVLASIFAAPDRLATAPIDSAQPNQSAAIAQSLLPQPDQIAQDLRASAKLEPAQNAITPNITPNITGAIAIAQAAVIEVEASAGPLRPNEATESIPASVSVTANLKARPITAARAGAKAQEPAIAPAVTAIKSAALKDMAEQAALPDIAQDITTPVIARTAETVQVQDVAPTARAEPRAERVDFATLVETLNRAREDASPNAVRVSLAHGDFGRVSMRFERDDLGMSVAMSSADPGFARAVAASNEAASTATSSDNPRGQSAQTNTSGTTPGDSRAQSDGNRQSPGQRADTPERPAAQLRDTLRSKDEPASSSGIFA